MRRGVVGVNHPPPCLTLNQSHDVTLTLLQDHFKKNIIKINCLYNSIQKINFFFIFILNSFLKR